MNGSPEGRRGGRHHGPRGAAAPADRRLGRRLQRAGTPWACSSRIVAYLRAGVRSYMAWNRVLDTVGKNIDSALPWPQNALLVVDRRERRLRETPAYWAFRHFSSFVDAGARLVDTTGGGDDAIAFRNPDGTAAVMLQSEREDEEAHAVRARNAPGDRAAGARLGLDPLLTMARTRIAPGTRPDRARNSGRGPVRTDPSRATAGR